MPFRITLPGFLALFLLSGCGNDGYTLAPVSGVVKLDGKPVAGLRISFEPIASEKNSTPGPESIAITDADGKFYLKTMSESPRSGAVVGNCRVRIWSLPAEQDKALYDDRSENYDPVAEVKAIRASLRNAGKKAVKPSSAIPLRYNDQTTLTFTVPKEGTSEASFEIQSK